MRRTSLLLTLLLVWSCALRLWLATPNPTAGRFWDERYGIENIHALVVKGQLRPANGFHPGFSYLPHAALCAASEGLHRLTGRGIFAIFDASGAMTPTGYLLCRFLQALAGTLSIYLTYRSAGPSAPWAQADHGPAPPLELALTPQGELS